MRTLLRWIPQYRELEFRLEQESGRVIDMQDRLNKLIEHNMTLERAAAEARAEQNLAHKSVANVFAQLSGSLPPYPEAYQLPRRDQPQTIGPVGSGRIFPRDVVRQGTQAFHRELYGMEVVPEQEVS